MPTILNFSDVTQEQINATAVVFAGHKSDAYITPEVLPEGGLAFEDDLPPDFADIQGAILPWASPDINIVLGILAERRHVAGESFRLFTVSGDQVCSYHLIPRYGKFYRFEADDEEYERGFLVGEWVPPNFAENCLLLWENLGPTYWGIMDRWQSAIGLGLYLELPGSWWGQLEFSETLSGVEP